MNLLFTNVSKVWIITNSIAVTITIITKDTTFQVVKSIHEKRDEIDDNYVITSTLLTVVITMNSTILERGKM